MKLLLHICCAPCLIYPLARLRSCGALVQGFFYNPSIAPPEEYRLRKQALLSYSSQVGLEVGYFDGEESACAVASSGAPGRCIACWRTRLMATAARAHDNGFDCFSTTLLVSPYQDHEALRRIGDEAALATGCAFYYEDFRPGFRQAREQARGLGLYRQKYCGCLASLQERHAVEHS